MPHLTMRRSELIQGCAPLGNKQQHGPEYRCMSILASARHCMLCVLRTASTQTAAYPPILVYCSKSMHHLFMRPNPTCPCTPIRIPFLPSPPLQGVGEGRHLVLHAACYAGAAHGEAGSPAPLRKRMPREVARRAKELHRACQEEGGVLWEYSRVRAVGVPTGACCISASANDR